MVREKAFRKRQKQDKPIDPEEEEETTGTRLFLDTRAQQRQRRRLPGISSDSLLEGAPQHDDVLARVPVNNGEPDDLMASYVKEEKKAAGSADPEMEKYIEQQMEKRLGKQKKAETEEPESQADRDERELYTIPDDLKGQKAVVHDSSAYMTGILEVPLDVDFKMRNIEETEAAKRRLLSGANGHEVDDEADVAQQTRGVHRVIYPRNFGRVSTKDADLRSAQLRSYEGQPSRHEKDRHKKR